MPPGAVSPRRQLIGAVGGAATQCFVGVQTRIGINALGLGDGLAGVQVGRGGG